ncbi:hypothetical protein BJX70DRAFT_397834 [Aspergillus crustosus]
MLTTCPICITLPSLQDPSIDRHCYELGHLRVCQFCRQTFTGNDERQPETFTYHESTTCPHCSGPVGAFDPAQGAETAHHLFGPGRGARIDYILTMTDRNGNETRYMFPDSPYRIRIGRPAWGFFQGEDGGKSFGWGIVEAWRGPGTEIRIRDPVPGVMVQGDCEYVFRALEEGREQELPVIGRGFAPVTGNEGGTGWFDDYEDPDEVEDEDEDMEDEDMDDEEEEEEQEDQEIEEQGEQVGAGEVKEDAEEEQHANPDSAAIVNVGIDFGYGYGYEDEDEFMTEAAGVEEEVNEIGGGIEDENASANAGEYGGVYHYQDDYEEELFAGVQ